MSTSENTTRFQMMPLEERIVLDAALVADVAAGATSSTPTQLTDVNGTLFFTANDGSHGVELFKTDGTTTTLVKDIRSGTSSSSPTNLVAMSGVLYFQANDGTNGAELWRSDGTSSGTYMVKNIASGSTGSSPTELTVSNGTLYFTANDVTNGSELWKSDGTSAGTVLVKNINAGSASSTPTDLIDMNGTLFFRSNDGTNGVELWKSDGTSTGTTLVKNIASGSANSTPEQLTLVNSTLYFVADDGVNGKEIWKSTGTSAGTVKVSSFSGDYLVSNMTANNGLLYFQATSSAAGAELWRSDGTSGGTYLLKDIFSGTGSSAPSNFTSVGNTLFFTADNQGGGSNIELWKTDGTASGTTMVIDFSVGADQDPTNLVNVNGTLYYAAGDGVNGKELWKSDGTSGGTEMVADIRGGSSSSFPLYITKSGDKLYFQATTGTSGVELWSYDLNAAPTVVSPLANLTVNEDAANSVIGLGSAFSDVNVGDTLTYSVVSNSNSGLVTTSISGSNLTLDYVANKNGTANITIRATDSSGLYVEDTFTVTVTAVADAPTVANVIPNLTVSEDAANSVISIASSFADADIATNGDVLTYSIVNNTNSSLVAATLSGTNITLAYGANKNGISTISVRATDSSGAFVDTSFTVTVNAVNDAPTVSNVIPNLTVSEDAANSVVSLASTFADLDIATNGDVLTYSIVGNTNSSLVTPTVSGSNITLAYGANKNGTSTITVRATDSAGGYVNTSFTVTVNAVSDAPTVANVIPNLTVNEDAANSVISLATTFADADIATNGDVLTYSIIGNTNATLLTPTLSGSNLTLAYGANKSGVSTITIRATDSTGSYIDTSFTATVTAVNDAPIVANVIPNLTVNEDAADSIVSIASAFTDVEGDTLTYSIVGNTNSALVTPTLSGTNITLAYGADKNGTSTITVRATDTSGAYVNTTFTVTVNPVSDAPIIANAIPNLTVNEDAANSVVSLSTAFTDVDLLNGDVLTYTIVSNSNSTLVTPTVSGSNLTLAYGANKSGVATITVRATDSTGSYVESTFTATVISVNDAPTIANVIPNLTVSEDAANSVVSIASSFTDADIGDSLTYSIVGNTNSALVTPTLSGTNITLAYAANKNGASTITVRATDSAGAYVDTTFTATVTSVNDAPTVSNVIPNVSVNEDAPNTVIGLGSVFADLDIATNGDVLTYSVVSNSNSGLVTPTFSGGNMTLAYAANKNGAANITIRATDSSGASVTTSFSVAVAAVADTPILVNAISNLAVDVGAPNTVLNLSSVFSDADVLTNGDTITLSVVGNTNSSLVTPSISGSNLTLDYAQAIGQSTITVRATDGSGNFVDTSFTVNVNNIITTSIVADLFAGGGNSNPSNLVDMNGFLYFTAADSTGVIGLYKTDGTTTTLLMQNSSGFTNPANFIAINNNLYFTITSTTYGTELWKTDGTPAGTTIVKDIYSGTGSANPSNLLNVNGTLFFTATDGTTGVELWKTDGTTAGTVIVKDIYSGASSSAPTKLTNIGGVVYFSATDATNGAELWKSDGTSSGTVLVKNIRAGSSSSTPDNLVNVGGTLYFTATDGTTGVELWKSDGTSGGTVLVKDTYSGNNATGPSSLTNVNGTLFFAATSYDGTTNYGSELWKSDGTTSGTVMVKDINVGTSGGAPTNLANVNGILYFSVDDGAAGAHGFELWRSDGTSAGTYLVKDINTGSASSSSMSLISYTQAGSFYFTADNGSNGRELWYSDGTAAGTQLAKDVYVGSTTSSPTNLTISGNKLFFTATNGTNGVELWSSEVEVAPYIASAMSDLTVNEDAASSNLSLASVFSDLNKDTVTYSVSSNSNSGLVTTSLSGNNLQLSYVANRNGVATITVRATDPSGLYVEDTFNVTVTSVNDAPTIANVIPDITVNEDASNTVVSLSSAFADVDIATSGDSLTYSIVGNTNSTLISPTISGTDVVLAYAANKSGGGKVIVRATDSAGAYVDTIITITVNSVNDAPIVANVIPNLTVSEDASNSVISIASSFTDADIGNTLTYSIVGNSNSSLVTPTLSGTNITLAYAANKNGASTITVRATDNTGLYVDTTFIATVTAVNDAPTVANVIPNVTVSEDAANSVISVASAFADLDIASNGDTLTYSIVGNSNSSLVTPTVSGSNITLAYVANKNGVSSITVRATDSAGAYVDTTFVATVTAVNDAPIVANVIPNVTVSEDASNSVVSIASAFTDVDILTNSDSLTYSIVGNSNSSLVTPTLSGTNITLAYAANKNGASSITVRATDSTGAYVDTTFIATVTAVNDTPTIANVIPNVWVNEDATNSVVSIASAFNDVDILTNSDSLTYSIVGNSNSALVTPTLSGTNITLAYAANKNGSSTITVRATDSAGAFVDTTFNAIVIAVNDAPTVANVIPTVSVSEDAPSSVISLSGVFSDVDIATNSDTLTYTVVSNSNGSLVSPTFSGSNMTLAYGANKNGSANITIRATDAAGITVDTSFVVNVAAVNDAPTVANVIPNVTVSEDASNSVISIASAFTDVDILTNSDSLTYSIVGNTDSSLVTPTLNGTNITLVYAPNKNGASTITVRATDSAGGYVDTTFIATITAVNDAPTVANVIPNVTVSEDAANTVVSVASAFADVDILTNSDSLTYSIVGNSNSSLVTPTVNGSNITLAYGSNRNGVSTITVRAMDSAGTFVDTTFTATVSAVNDAPTEANVIPTISVSEDAPSSVINLSTVFSDVDIATNSDTLTYTVVSNSNGSLVTPTFSGSNMTLAYGANKNGSANITIRATDAAGTSIDTSFVVNVAAVSDAPTVANVIPNVSVSEDASNSVISIASAFTDVDILTNSDSLTYSIVGNSNSSLVTPTLSGTDITLAYAANKNGASTITVRATDSTGGYVDTTFVATVTPVNDAPTVANVIPNVTVNEDASNTVVSIANAFTDVDILTNSDSLTYSIVGNSNSSLVTPTVNGTNITLAYAANKNGASTITVRATDSVGAYVETTFIATVTAVNDAPTVANVIPNVTVSEDAANSVVSIANAFTDLDILTNSDSLTYSIVGNSNSSLVTPTVSGTNITLAYAANKNGASTITVRATDSAGAFVETTFVATVTAVNDAPIVANVIPNVTVSEDAANSVVSIASAFADADIAANGDALTYSIVGNSNSSLVTPTLSGTNITLAYAANKNGASNITVRATDSTGAYVDTTFIATVTAVNDAPTVANVIPNVTVSEDASNTVVSIANAFTDLDILTNSDSLTYSIVGNSNASLVTPTLSGTNITLAYAANKNGVSNITLRATDSAGAYVETTFIATVTAVNDAPTVANVIPNISVSEDAANSIVSIANAFTDLDILTNSDSLTYSIVGNSNASLVTPTLSGTNITLAYAANKNGASTITVRATDSAGTFVDTTFIATVTPVNDAPTIANVIPNVTVSEDAANSVVSIASAFADADIAANGDALTYSIVGNSNSSLVIPTLSGTNITLAYAANKNGASNITVRATDSTGAYVETTFIATVTPVNDAPTVANIIPNVTVAESAPNTVLNLANTFADVDILTNGDNVTLSIVSNTNSGLVSTSLVGSSLTLAYVPNMNGVADVTVRATDSAGNFVQDTFRVVVNSVANAPTIIQAIPDITVNEDASSSVINLSGTFSDPDILTNGDIITLSIVDNSNGSLVTPTLVGNTLTLAYAANQNGTAEITVRATDQSGNTVEDTFSVTVNAINDAPILTSLLPDLNLNEDAPNTVISLSTIFSNVDDINGDTLTYSIVDNSDSSLVSTSFSGDNLTLSYAANRSGTATIIVKATDNAGNSVQDSFNVVISPVNDVPTVTTIPNITVNEDAANTVLNLASSFSDVDILTNGDSLTYSIVNNSNGSLVTPTLSGSNLTLAYAANKNGTGSITVRATDSTGAFVEDTFYVTVNALADAPTVANLIPDVTVNEDAINTVLNLANIFADSDILTNGDTLTLSIQSNSNSGLVVPSLSGNFLSLDYQDNKHGSSTITIRATDSSGNFVQDTFVVTVNPLQDVPTVANAIPNLTVSEDAPNTVLNLSNVFNDADVLTAGDSLTLSIVGNSNGSLLTPSLSGNNLTMHYNANQHGTSNVTIRATDSAGNFVQNTFQVTVNAAADAPVVSSAIANLTVNEDAPNTVLNLSSVFADADIATAGDSLIYSVSSNSNGSLVSTSMSGANLTLAYVPNQNGVANITVRATDSTGNFVENTFGITVNAIDDAPFVANVIPDITVSEDAPNTVIDLSSIFDDFDIVNGDSLTFSIAGNTNTTVVSASLSGNNLTLAYAANLNGAANITVRGTDSAGNFVQDTFTVTVTAESDAPVVGNAIPDISVNEEATPSVLNLSNAFTDSDILNGGDILTLSIVGNDNSDLVTPELNGNLLTLNYAPDKNGNSSITIRATDSAGNFVDDTFIVTVNPINDTPVIANVIADITVNEDAPNSVLDLSFTFDDVDVLTNTDALTISVVGNSNSSLVTATMSGNSLVLHYNANQHGSSSITVRATDETGTYVETVFNATVNAVADAPIVVNALPNMTVNEDAPNTVLNLANAFADSDMLTDGDHITLSIVGNSNNSLVSTSLSGNNLTLAYAANKNGFSNITVRATDDAGNFVQNTFRVTVTGVQDAPLVLNAVPDLTVNEDSSFTILSLSSAFTDVDIGDTLTYSVVNNSNPGMVTTLISSNTIRLDYGANKNGFANITVRATDSAGNFAEDTFKVTVNPVQDAPFVANIIPDISVSEDAANTVINLANTFTDLDVASNGDVLTYSIVSNTNSSLVSASTSGNNLTLAYGANKNGAGTITVRATDTAGNFVDTAFSVNVAAVQDAPIVANAIPSVSVVEDSPNTVLNLSTAFTDSDILTNGDSITLSIVGNSNNSLVTAGLSGSDLTLAYAPNKNGVSNITIRATDSVGNYVENTFAVNVSAVQDAPVVANVIPNISVNEDAANTVINLANTFSDVDVLTNSDQLTFSVFGNTNSSLVSASISGNSLTLAYGANQNGAASITVRATDSAGNTVDTTFAVAVSAVQDVPVVANVIPSVSVNEDAPNTVISLANVFADSDILTNADSLTLSVKSNTNTGLLNTSISGNSLILSYNPDQNGSAVVTLKAVDTAGNAVETSFNVTVAAQGEAPTILNAIPNITVNEDAANTVLSLANTFADADILTNGDTITLSIIGNTNGSMVTPSLSGNNLTLAYAANKNGVATITVRATDSQGNYVDDIFNVTVNSVADAPTVQNAIANITVSEDAPNTVLNLSSVFADSDILTNGDTLTLSITNNTNSSLLTPTLSGNNLTLAYLENKNGSAQITVRATDSTGNFVQNTFNVTVTPVADAPTIQNAIPNILVSEGAPNSVINLSTVFADADILTNSDTLTLTIVSNSKASIVNPSISGNNLTLNYAPHKHGISDIVIKATDSAGNFVLNTFRVTIIQLNEAPILLNAMPDLTVAEDAPNTVLDLTQVFSDYDFDDGDSLIYTVTTNTNGALVTSTVSGTSLNLAYAANKNGISDITVKATDTAGNFVQDTFRVTVTAVQDAPIIVNALPDLTVNEDAPSSIISLSSAFTDVDILSNGDSLTYTVVSNNNSSLVTPSVSGGNLTLAYGANKNGAATITIRATDTAGNFADDTFIVNVNSVQDAPTVANIIPDITVNEDAPTTVLNLSNVFADVDILTNSDSITLSVVGNTNNGIVSTSLSGNNLSLAYLPNQSGIADITIRATDSAGNFVQDTFRVNINAVADAPVVANPVANITVDEGSANTVLNISSVFSDADIAAQGDSLIYTITSNTNSALITSTISGDNITLAYAPNRNGVANITVRATDSTGSFVENTFGITVNSVNNAPIINTALPDFTVNEDAPNSIINLSSFFSDVDILTDSDSLTYSIAGNTNVSMVTGSLSGSNLTLAYAADKNGFADIKIRATDTSGAYIEDTFRVTVNPVSDVPIIANAIPNITVNEDAPNTVLNLSTAFTDADILNGDTLTLSVVSNSNNGLVTSTISGQSLTLGYAADKNGIADIRVRATDSTGNFVENTFRVTVTPVADAPVIAIAIPDLTVNEDASNTVLNLSSFFSDVDVGDQLTITVSGNSNTSLVTPNISGNNLTLAYSANANGIANITLRATDASGNYVEDTFRVTVNPMQDAPIVASSMPDIIVNEDAPSTVINLGNSFTDYDLANNDTLTFTVTSNSNSSLVTTSVSGGSLSLNYLPNQFGVANITVRATDSAGNFVQDTFQVTVNSVEDAPTINNVIANIAVNEDAAPTVLNLSNVFADSDILAEGDILSLSIVNNNNPDMVTPSLNGNLLTLNYVPDINGIAHITIRATDALGHYVDDTFTVTVNPINDAPVIANTIPDIAVNEDAPNSVLDLTYAFDDVDTFTNSDTLTFSVFGNSNSSLATASISGNSLVLQYLPNKNGIANITVRATDETGSYVDTTFKVTVNSVADAPTVANALPNMTVNEDAPNTILNLANVFADNDILTAGDQLTLTVVSNTNSSLVSTSMSGNNLTLAYGANKNGFANITIRATDTSGNFVQNTFKVTVTAVQDAPIVQTPMPNLTVNEDSAATTLSLSSVFTDPDIGDTLTYSVVNNSNSGLVTTLISGNTVRLDYAANKNGFSNITIRAMDSLGNFTENTFKVTVNPVQDAPVIANVIPNLTVNEDAANTVINLSSAFSDVDILTNSDSLSYSVISNTNSSLVGTSFSGTSLNLAYAPNKNGSASITVRATDSSGNFVNSTFTVAVNAVSDMPIIIHSIPDLSVNEDAPNTVFDLNQIFSDPDILTNSDQLSFSVVNNTNNQVVNAQIVNNILSLNYINNHHGSASITIQARDKAGNIVEDTFNVNVIAVQSAPVVDSQIPNIIVNEDAPNTILDLSTVFSDEDVLNQEETLTLSILGNTNGDLVTATLNGNQLSLSYAPNGYGNANITIRATDSFGNFVDDSFTVTVNPVNDLPIVANLIPSINVNEDDPNTVIDISNVFSDVEALASGNDTLHVEIDRNSNPSLLNASLNNGILTLHYNQDKFGDARITLRAVDNNGATVLTSFDVHVEGVSDAPVQDSLIPTLVINEDTGHIKYDLKFFFKDVDQLSDSKNFTYEVIGNSNTDLISSFFDKSKLNLDLAPNKSGEGQLMIRVSDNEGNFIDSAVNIVVRPVNDAPIVVNPIPALSVSRGSLNTVLDISNVFHDPDYQDTAQSFAKLNISISGNTNARLVTPVIQNGQLVLNYDPTLSGNAEIRLRAMDADGAFVETSVQIRVADTARSIIATQVQNLIASPWMPDASRAVSPSTGSTVQPTPSVTVKTTSEATINEISNFFTERTTKSTDWVLKSTDTILIKTPIQDTTHLTAQGTAKVAEIDLTTSTASAGIVYFGNSKDDVLISFDNMDIHHQGPAKLDVLFWNNLDKVLDTKINSGGLTVLDKGGSKNSTHLSPITATQAVGNAGDHQTKFEIDKGVNFIPQAKAPDVKIDANMTTKELIQWMTVEQKPFTDMRCVTLFTPTTVPLKSDINSSTSKKK